jgi:two-component system, sensor histidine kinase and response regulator
VSATQVEPQRSPRTGLRVLLVEDNPVNQMLVLCLLEKRGHQVVPARNGKDALAALESQQFDLVLMDVQMPEMDGFDATKLIRSGELKSGRHIPIIAMTAHTMKGDQERCLEAGMDAYVTKPVQSKGLLEVINQLFPGGGGGVTAGADDSAERVDRAALLARLGGREDRLRKVARMFLDESARLLGEIRAAIDQRSTSRIAQAAHALRGALGIFDAEKATDAVQRLEKLARSSALEGAEERYQTLRLELDRLRKMIGQLADEAPQCAP